MIHALDPIFLYFTSSGANVMLVLGLIVFGGAYVGRFFQRLRIPQVVGYIAIGIVLGQSGLRILNSALAANLAPFNSFALAIIGFMVGGELKIGTVRKYGKQFTSILLFEALTAFLIVGLLVTLVSYLLFKDIRLAVSLGLLLGAISSATAPAATTDVLWENKSRGPLTTMILGVVAMDDAVALLLFAVATSISGALLGQATESFGMALLKLVYEIGISLVLGTLAGAALKHVTRRFVDEARVLAFSMGALLLIVGLSVLLGADLILAAMTMGFFTVNFSPRKSAETFKVVENFSPPIYVLFFVLVGAKLDIRSLTLITGIIALVYVLGRTAGKFLGSWLGALLSAAPSGVRRYLPFCLFSQAGVAIGLSIVAGQAFPGMVGNTIIATVAATTFIVQIIGPSFVKFAITKAGEVGLDIGEDDLLKDAFAADLVDQDAPPVKETALMDEVLSTFSTHDSLYYPVVDTQNRLQGIVTVASIKDTFALRDFGASLLAWDLMEKTIAFCPPDLDAKSAREQFLRGSYDYLAVLDKEGKSLGLIDSLGIRRFISLKMLEYNKRLGELEAS